MATVTSAMRWLGRAALDLVYPPRCAGCERPGAFFCERCVGELTPASGPRCRRCWQPRAGDACLDCAVTPPAFDALRSAFVYEGVAREVVHALKYRGMTSVVGPMASLLAAAVRQHQLEPEIIVPVPLSGLRQRLRGYNQAEALARALGRELGVPVRRRALARTRSTSPQARAPDAETRRRNVAGAFTCREPRIAGRRVLLVDDVTTTGATLSECARALKEAGASAAWAVTFARED